MTKTLKFLPRGLHAVVLFYLELDHIGQMQAENSRPKSVIQPANLPTSSSLFLLQIFNGQISMIICQPVLGHLLKMNKKHIAKGWLILMKILPLLPTTFKNVGRFSLRK